MRRWLVHSAALVLAGLASTISAQDLRDPTQPPAAASQPLAGSGTEGGASSNRSLSIIVRDGKPYLVVDTRLYAQGQRFGKTQVVRITETEVTLREDGQTRVLRPFEGIQRRTVADVPACAASAPQAGGKNKKKGKADVACSNTKP